MTQTLAPIIKEIDVPLDPDRAFDLFIKRLDSWWPVESHSLSAYGGAKPKNITVEPREGGKIIETTNDGTKAPWGTITHWEPGARLGLSWYVGRPEAEATQIDVTFAVSGGGTRLRLVHSGFAAHGTDASASAANYASGWDMVLARYLAQHVGAVS